MWYWQHKKLKQAAFLALLVHVVFLFWLLWVTTYSQSRTQYLLRRRGGQGGTGLVTFGALPGARSAASSSVAVHDNTKGIGLTKQEKKRIKQEKKKDCAKKQKAEKKKKESPKKASQKLAEKPIAVIAKSIKKSKKEHKKQEVIKENRPEVVKEVIQPTPLSHAVQQSVPVQEQIPDSIGLAAGEYESPVAQQLAESFYAAWRPPAGFGHCSCEINVTVNHQGKALKVDMLKSSGVIIFDQSVKTAAYRIEYPAALWNKVTLLKL